MLVLAPSAMGLPTMIRLGYPNCASCHVSPQGAGLLNLYGRSVDQAQSMIGGEYQPSENPFVRDINLEGRINQDFRIVMQQQDTSTTNKAGTQLFRSRFMYRNATELGQGFRFTGTITGENTAVPRPTLVYDPPVHSAEIFFNTALLSYRATPTLEFAAGRDQLPTGVNISDLSYFIRSRNRIGYYDSPTQVKAFWWGKRYATTPYAYAPGGNERTGEHESGGGVLAEVDVLGKQKTVVGVNVLHGTARNDSRTLVGPYARLGFGRWGFLAEHDITQRTPNIGTVASFRQNTSYGQLFWAAREWLVASLIGERLTVERPYTEHLTAARLELSARFTPQVTVTAGPRLQKDAVTGRVTTAVIFQVALKTVH
jgi:hypothetical protein